MEVTLMSTQALAHAAPNYPHFCYTYTPGQQISTNQISKFSAAVRAGMPVWQQAGGLPKHWRTLHLALADGDEVNQVNGTHRYFLLFNNTD
jgi:hypothetical protein